MREPNSFGHRLGWPGLLALIEPEAKPSHVTQQRAVVKPEWVAKFRLDLTPADTIGHFGPERLAEVRKFFTPVNGPAQAPQSESSQDKPATQPDSEGWIAWGGGKCPVPAGTRVIARLRRGGTKQGVALEQGFTERNWAHEVEGTKDYEFLRGLDITHYRVVKP